MKVAIVAVPYDSGIRGVRMGNGPAHLIDNGLPDHLTDGGHDVSVEVVHADADALTPEPKVASFLWLEVRDRVRAATEVGAFPLLLSGSCYATLGVVAGLGTAAGSLWWFDAHGDCNTPETTTSGFLDGMAVSMLTGRCWRALSRRVEGFRPIAERDVVLLGVRDLDDAEATLLDGSAITAMDPGATRRGLWGIVMAKADAHRRSYIHLDLDVLDSSEGRANALASSGGLLLREVEAAVSTIAGAFSVSGLSVTAYDPDCDTDGRVQRAAFQLIDQVLGTGRAIPDRSGVRS